jgi:death-on-curing protein
MAEPIWLLPEVLLALHKAHLAEHGGAEGLRDAGLFESALARPQNRWSYSADASLFELAASYCYGLAKNHASVDGNKRTALVSLLLFLELNGYRLKATQEQRYEVVLKVASGDVEEEQLTEWIQANATAI